MAKYDILDILKAKKMSPLDFNFESLWIPPMNNYLTPQDIEALRKIATSIKLSSKINQKYDMIDNIMRNRGFKRFSAGTNRVVYSYLEDTRFLAKIAVDKVGMQDNPMEFKNQFLLKPFVTKMFYHSPCGTVGFVERVLPIKNKQEFKQIASDVFDILINKILGEYVMEDIGTRYFMNWGIRVGCGPVLLDFPYVYKLDGNKLFCTKVNPITNERCDGEIDYDAGFNHLVCTKCGKIYLASDLRDNSVNNKIVIKKGGIQMKIALKEGDRIIATSVQSDDVITRSSSKPRKKVGINDLVVMIRDPKKGLIKASSGREVKRHDIRTVDELSNVVVAKRKEVEKPKNEKEAKSEEKVEQQKPVEKVKKSTDSKKSEVKKVEEEKKPVKKDNKEKKVSEEKVSDDKSEVSTEEVKETKVEAEEKENNTSEPRVKTKPKQPRTSDGRFASNKHDKSKSNFIVTRNK